MSFDCSIHLRVLTWFDFAHVDLGTVSGSLAHRPARTLAWTTRSATRRPSLRRFARPHARAFSAHCQYLCASAPSARAASTHKRRALPPRARAFGARCIHAQAARAASTRLRRALTPRAFGARCLHAHAPSARAVPCGSQRLCMRNRHIRKRSNTHVQASRTRARACTRQVCAPACSFAGGSLPSPPAAPSGPWLTRSASATESRFCALIFGAIAESRP